LRPDTGTGPRSRWDGGAADLPGGGVCLVPDQTDTDGRLRPRYAGGAVRHRGCGRGGRERGERRGHERFRGAGGRRIGGLADGSGRRLAEGVVVVPDQGGWGDGVRSAEASADGTAGARRSGVRAGDTAATVARGRAGPALRLPSGGPARSDAQRRGAWISAGRQGAGTMTNMQDLSWLLANFCDRVPGVAHAVAVSADGLLLAASRDLPRDRADQLAAIASGLVSLTQGASRCFEGGAVLQTVVEMDNGFLFL